MKTAVYFSIGVVLLITNFLLADVSIEVSPVSEIVRQEHIVDAPSVIAATVDDDVSHFVTDRQLFSPERRDFAAAAIAPFIPAPPLAVAAETQPMHLDIKLIGTRNIRASRAALMQYSDADAEWFPLGETIEGWTIHEISSREVTLVSGDERRIIVLDTDSVNDE